MWVTVGQCGPGSGHTGAGASLGAFLLQQSVRHQRYSQPEINERKHDKTINYTIIGLLPSNIQSVLLKDKIIKTIVKDVRGFVIIRS